MDADEAWCAVIVIPEVGEMMTPPTYWNAAMTLKVALLNSPYGNDGYVRMRNLVTGEEG